MSEFLLAPGTYTVGPDGDYPDFYELALALGAMTGPSASAERNVPGDYTFRVVGAFSNPFTMLLTLRYMGGNTITFDCDEDLIGDPTRTDRLVEIQNNDALVDFGGNAVTAHGDTGHFVIDGLYLKAMTHSTSNLAMIRGSISLYGSPTPQRSLTIKNCMFNMNGHRSSITKLGPNWSGTALRIIKNCKAWNCYDTGGLQDYVVYGTTQQVENNTFHGAEVGPPEPWYTSGISPRNNALVNLNPISEFSYTTLDGGNASTNPGEVENDFVAADEFESLDDSSPDFLKLKDLTMSATATATPSSGTAPLKVSFSPSVSYSAPGVLAQQGVAPTYATTDIEGNARPGVDGYYSIGCHEAVVA